MIWVSTAVNVVVRTTRPRYSLRTAPPMATQSQLPLKCSKSWHASKAKSCTGIFPIGRSRGR